MLFSSSAHRKSTGKPAADIGVRRDTADTPQRVAFTSTVNALLGAHCAAQSPERVLPSRGSGAALDRCEWSALTSTPDKRGSNTGGGFDAEQTQLSQLHDASAVTVPLSSVEAVSLMDADEWFLHEGRSETAALGDAGHVEAMPAPADDGGGEADNDAIAAHTLMHSWSHSLRTPQALTSTSQPSNPSSVSSSSDHVDVDADVSLDVIQDRSFEEEVLHRRLASLRAEVDHMYFEVEKECSLLEDDEPSPRTATPQSGTPLLGHVASTKSTMPARPPWQRQREIGTTGKASEFTHPKHVPYRESKQLTMKDARLQKHKADARLPSNLNRGGKPASSLARALESEDCSACSEEVPRRNGRCTIDASQLVASGDCQHSGAPPASSAGHHKLTGPIRPAAVPPRPQPLLSHEGPAPTERVLSDDDRRFFEAYAQSNRCVQLQVHATLQKRSGTAAAAAPPEAPPPTHTGSQLHSSRTIREPLKHSRLPSTAKPRSCQDALISFEPHQRNNKQGPIGDGRPALSGHGNSGGDGGRAVSGRALAPATSASKLSPAPRTNTSSAEMLWTPVRRIDDTLATVASSSAKRHHRLLPRVTVGTPPKHSPVTTAVAAAPLMAGAEKRHHLKHADPLQTTVTSQASENSSVSGDASRGSPPTLLAATGGCTSVDGALGAGEATNVSTRPTGSSPPPATPDVDDDNSDIDFELFSSDGDSDSEMQ